MSANCDHVTGVAYGVLQGSHAPQLDQDIFENGHDETYENWCQELRKDLENMLKDPDIPEYREDDEETRRDAMEAELRAAIMSLDVMHPAQLLKACLDDGDCIDVRQGLFDIDAIYDFVKDHESQFYECDEPEHTWQDGETYYRRSHLGGAALIWVCRSRYVTPCRTCSPCVMGAGDLCSVCPPERANNLAYCPPPADWVDDIDEDRKPYVIYKTDDNGYPTEEVAWQRKD